MRNRALLARWAVPIAILTAPLILYAPFVFGSQAIFWGTPLLQFWPWRVLAGESLRAGAAPLWNPYSGSGLPLLADHQSAVLYPLNVIFWFLPVDYAMGLSLALHAVLAGATMFALARELGISRLGALIAALAFMLSGYMVSRGSFLTEISALPWLPLLWLATRRLVHRPRPGDVIGLGAAAAMQFLAGHAQTWFYSLVSVGLVALWETGRRIARATREARQHDADRRVAWRHTLSATATSYALLALAVILALLLSAAQFLPTLELSREAGRGERADWETYALQYSFWPWRAFTLLMPDFFGSPVRGDYWGYATYWEDAGYIGVLPTVFALLAVAIFLRRRRRKEPLPAMGHVPGLAALAALAMLMALGKNTPFYMFFYRYVPGFGSFQAPARWLCVYTPAVALLAGIGVDLLRPSQRLTFVVRLAVAGGVAVGLTAFGAQQVLSDVTATFFGPLIRFAAWFVASLFCLLWGQRVVAAPPNRPQGALYASALVLVAAADLLLAGRGLNPGTDRALYRPETEIGAFLNQEQEHKGRIFMFGDVRQEVLFGAYLDFGDYGPSDVTVWREMRESLLPDLSIVEHIPSANTFEPLVEGRYHALLEALDEAPRPQAVRVLGRMNVAYLLDPALEGVGEPVYRGPELNVYRNPHVLPRARVACQALPADSSGEALSLLLSAALTDQQVVLETENVLPATSCDGARAVVLRSLSNQVTIEAVLPEPGYLVLADTNYPGWQAIVDGQRVEIARADYAFRAISLPAGEHRVVFRYRPTLFVVGAVCSAFSWAGLGAWGAIALVRRQRAILRSLKP